MLRRKRHGGIAVVAAGKDSADITREPAADRVIEIETTLKETEYVLEKV